MNLPQLAAPLVGHPLIVILQLIAFPLGIWLFTVGAWRTFGVRLLYFLLPFSVLANVLARTFRLEWLYMTDIALWMLLIASLVVSAIYVRHQKHSVADLRMKLMARGIDPAELGLLQTPDPFARWQNQAVLLAIAVSFGVVSWAFIRTFAEKQLQQEEHQTDVQQEANKLSRAHLSEAQEAACRQQQLNAGLASLSATTAGILKGQQKLSQGQRTLSKQVDVRTSTLAPISDSTNRTRKDVRDIKKQIDSEGKPGWFQRLKDRLHLSHRDSTDADEHQVLEESGQMITTYPSFYLSADKQRYTVRNGQLEVDSTKLNH